MQQARLAAWLLRELGQELRAMAPVSGGCIHCAWRLELADGGLLFAKTNLAAEADGLRALASARTGLMIPSPLRLAELDGTALLLLSWLNLAERPADPEVAWRDVGAELAGLHRSSLVGHDGRFGWGQDNFIGTGPQANGWQDSWGRFFAEQRLGCQLAWAGRSGHRLAEADALLERVPAWLASHPAEPCLVHGDLWSGNASLLAGGGGALFDPAVYRGDREVDLAMAQLFGGFPQAFFVGYAAAWPLPAGHRQRVELYNLYHLLNHANLFGGSYWSQAERSIATLLRQWN